MSCLPKGTELMRHQIAGHVFGEDDRNLGMLRHPSGFVLKRIDGERGQRELKFYNEVFTSTDHYCSLLKEFLPFFCGTYSTELRGSKLLYLQLDDLTAGYKFPCIMDIKIGKQTWNPDASPKKREREESKYSGTKQTLGFCIPGFKFYDLVKQEDVIEGKEYGKSLTIENIASTFLLFLNSSNTRYRLIVSKFLSELIKICDYFDNQRTFHFYASSLLFVYDASCLMDPHSDVSCRVKMIDFAHVFSANGKRDENYLFGLKSVISIFQNILIR